MTKNCQGKHVSLFAENVGDEEKKVYNVDDREAMELENR
jgi:hypothetical protein